MSSFGRWVSLVKAVSAIMGAVKITANPSRRLAMFMDTALNTIGRTLRTFETSRPQLLAIEVVFLALCITALAFVWIAGMRPYWPNMESLRFILKHYVGAASISAVVLLALTALRFGTDVSRRRLTFHLRVFAAFFGILILHFNFKLWSGLVNPALYDDLYQRADRLLNFSPEIFTAARNALSLMAEHWLVNPYHELFVGLFFIGLVLAASRSRLLYERAITATGLVLGLGAIAYCIAPAHGPFVLGPGMNENATAIQGTMMSFYRTFINSNGHTYDASFFGAAVAAMPSLHAANALVLTWYAWKASRWSLIVTGPVLLYIYLEAVANRFHYAVDLIAGTALAIFCIALANRWIPKRLTETSGAGSLAASTGPA